MIQYPEALDRLRQRAVGGRVLIGICGAPGSGKTVLAERLVADLNAGTAGVAAHVPMDGFHLANATLARLGRADRKGAPDTFDAWGYAALLRRIRDRPAEPIYAPDFDRTLEEPVAGAIEVAPDVHVVVSEGNYLLVPEQPWPDARAAFDEVWFCVVPEEVRMARLVARHMRFGRTEAEARRWATEVDGPNAALIARLASSADLEVSTAEDSMPSGA